MKLSRRGCWSAGSVLAFSLVLAGIPLFQQWVVQNPWRLAIDLAPVRCLPYRLYINHMRVPEHIQRGDFLVVRVPALKKVTPLDAVKMVGAVPGDMIEVSADNLFYINGQRWGDLHLLGLLHESLDHYVRREVVPPDHYLLLGTGSESYDGRYWGYITRDQIYGTAKPIF